ncbi:MAG: RES domain-containing protein [Gammaproteobacteria bacterium]|nr:RES domain-containing protein [Gammaproteobacteria bacterium]
MGQDTRALPAPLRAFRIGDPHGQFPVFSAEGAMRVAGRWHEAGAEVIYASQHYSTAMLENLVKWNGTLPPNQHFIEITVPQGISYDVVTAESLPGLFDSNQELSRRYGRDWYAEARSAVLVAPSVVARVENNIVLNCQHPEFADISAGLETPVWWDARLFRN